VLTLPDEDRAGALYERLHARKTLERLDLAQEGVGAPAAAIAQATVERHLRGALTLIVVNTVDLAQSVYRELERRLEGANIVLVHSRFRPAERRAHMERALDTPGDSGTIVVATQVVEAGVDMSAHLLVTETAPFSSIVQRLGRCNRSGKDSDAAVLWLDRGPVGDGASGRKAAAPYLPTDIDASRNALLEREGASLSPAVLEGISVREMADDPSTYSTPPPTYRGWTSTSLPSSGRMTIGPSPSSSVTFRRTLARASTIHRRLSATSWCRCRSGAWASVHVGRSITWMADGRGVRLGMCRRVPR
jgi:hypothetical protein